MAPKSIFGNLLRAADGSILANYGGIVLKSALQPIFSSHVDKGLRIEAFEGFVRAFRNEESISPAEFFGAVPQQDMADIDSLLRTIHILNTGRMNRANAKIFVKFRPGLFRTPQEMRVEVDRIKLAGHEASMPPDRIVCEISEQSGATDDIIVTFCEHMRAVGLRIAIADYGAGDADLRRMKRIRPDYVKFDGGWIRESMSNSAGSALLRVIVGQMLDDGIEPIFEGLEEVWQIDLCEELSVPLIQGYALARPELAPTTFNEVFPDDNAVIPPRPPAYEPPGNQHVSPVSPPPPALVTSALARPSRTFGRRIVTAK